ncbi:MAG TPA: zinc ribbon domain-containing protein [Pseudohongiella sp.]|nr:zinc ribbon domain-containing protein [Pseudohongiella sp.]
MPIYEYQCKECGHRLEAIQRFSDAPLTLCPVCNKEGLAKQLSAPSFRLKGGGWYETDFKTGNKRHGTQGDNNSGGSSGSAAAGA